MGWFNDLIIRIKGDSTHLNSTLDKTSSQIDSWASKAAGFFAKAFAVTAVLKFTAKVVELGAKAEGIRNAFDKLNQPTLLSNLRRATQSTVADVDLMSAAVRANNFNIALENLPKYFEFAARRARDTGESVDYLVDSIVMGIGRKSVMILDNLGLSAADIREELQKTPDYATAVGNIIEREMKKAGAATKTTADSIAQLKTAWKNFAEGAGAALNKSGVSNLLERWATQMRILGDESMTFAQKGAMIMATRIDKSAYDNYLAHQQRVNKGGATGYNPAMGAALAAGMGGQFNMLSGITPPQQRVENLTTLKEELELLMQQFELINKNDKAELARVARSIKAKQAEIDAIEKLIEEQKKQTRTILDAQQQWDSLVGRGMEGKGGTWGALSGGFANMGQGLASMEQSRLEIQNEITQWQQMWQDAKNSLSDLAADTVQGMFEAIGSGDWSNFGREMLLGFANFLSILGRQMIALALAESAFMKALSNPAMWPIALAAGIAAVAAAGLIRGTIAAGSSAMGGGGSGSYASGANSASLNTIKVIVEGKTRGKDIYWSNRRYSDEVRRNT